MILPQAAMGAVDPVAQALMPPQEAFVWGHGGLKMSPQEAAAMRARGVEQMQGDYSPIQHWTQGLGRVADNVLGALDVRNAEKEQAAGREADMALMEAMSAGQVDDSMIARALMDPNVGQGVREFAGMEYAARRPKAAAPHYWETNNGSLGMVGPDGRPVVLYEDPTPKVNYITADNPDGTKQIIPVGPNGPIMGGGGQASGAQPGGEPPAVLPPDFDFGEGGQASAPGGFRR